MNKKIIAIFSTIIFAMTSILVYAVEYDTSSSSGDDETYKEYTATIVDLQVDTVMALDDEFSVSSSSSDRLSGAMRMSKTLEDGTIEYFEEMPQVYLVDEDNTIVAQTEIYSDVDDFMGTQEDLYYIYFSNLNIQNNVTYRIMVIITDNDENTIQKYITYYDSDIVASASSTLTMSYESVNNIMVLSFIISSDEETILGDLNGDGSVDAVDAALALDFFKYGGETEEDLNIGDMDEDGDIDATDAALILDVYKYGSSSDEDDEGSTDVFVVF